ncbi:hypothetical protein AB6A40_008146 [Gnathostoma spinigerum]|uniref:Uncharacterized protein n=1 Tax=Gnathostoma spinigerum TaxID=75299 RepID=A0ABD6EXM0_9BILA
MMLIINKYRLRHVESELCLSAKYQLVENIRILRSLYPAFIFDCLSVLADSTIMMLFDNDSTTIIRRFSYVEYVLIALQTVSFVCEWMTPISILLRLPVYKKYLLSSACVWGLCRRKSSSGSVVLKNVLGQKLELRQQTQNAYFDQYKWNAP